MFVGRVRRRFDGREERRGNLRNVSASDVAGTVHLCWRQVQDETKVENVATQQHHQNTSADCKQGHPTKTLPVSFTGLFRALRMMRSSSRRLSSESRAARGVRNSAFSGSNVQKGRFKAKLMDFRLSSYSTVTISTCHLSSCLTLWLLLSHIISNLTAGLLQAWTQLVMFGYACDQA